MAAATTTAKAAKKERSKARPGNGRRPEDDAGADRRLVLILGAGKRALRVRDVIRRLGLRCLVEPEPLQVLEDPGEDTRIVVVVPPLPDLSAADFCRRLRDRTGGADLPIFVISPADRETRRLYEAGATGQFEWPDESAAVVRAILRVVGIGSGQHSVNARDAALASRVEERLGTERETFGPLVQVQVQRGVVVLAGEVDALWKVSEIERYVSAIPGVRHVVTHFLRIPASGIPDRVIGASVRSVLRNTVGLDPRTFATRVTNGHVLLTGTASNRRELSRVVGLIGQVRGVRGIENLATIAPGSKAGESRLAGSLTRLATRQFPESRVRVEVFGRVAVLSGKARDEDERRAMEQLASDHPRIDRVISKLV